MMAAGWSGRQIQPGGCDAVIQNADYCGAGAVRAGRDRARAAAARQGCRHGRRIRQRRVGQPVRRDRLGELPVAHDGRAGYGFLHRDARIDVPRFVQGDAVGRRTGRDRDRAGICAGGLGAGRRSLCRSGFRRVGGKRPGPGRAEIKS
ncbi:hypothetical protein BVI2075_740017 [Burkholderia vietnamiensis]|nr:hypothetical protein BVI2075_740017 [Burkholderia vietnamiensis]